MVDDEVKQKVRKFLEEEGYGATVADSLFGVQQLDRMALAKEAMKELIRANCSRDMIVKMTPEEISRAAFQQADMMILREAWKH